MAQNEIFTYVIQQIVDHALTNTSYIFNITLIYTTRTRQMLTTNLSQMHV